MKFIFANCKVCNRDVFNEKELVAFKRLRPLHLERVNLEGQQPWTGMLCICLQCVHSITQATDAPPEVEEMFEAMKKQFHANREKYRVKSFEVLCRQMFRGTDDV